MTIDECIFGHGNANEKREYSSTTVSMYVLWDEVGSGPLKSMPSHSIGYVALMSTPRCGR